MGEERDTHTKKTTHTLWAWLASQSDLQLAELEEIEPILLVWLRACKPQSTTSTRSI